MCWQTRNTIFLLKAEDRANLVVYSLEPHPKLIAFHRTEAQLLRVKLLPGSLVHYIGQVHGDLR